MNKTIAWLILGVILLAMILIIVNQYVTQTDAEVSSASSASAPVAPPVIAADATEPQPMGSSSGSLGAHSSIMQERGLAVPPAVQPSPSPSISPSPVPSHPHEVISNDTLSPTSTAAPVPAPAPTPAMAKPAPAKPITPAPVAPSPKATKISVSSTAEGAQVRIESNQPMQYTTMRLNNPERVVVDLQGEWAIKAPGVPNNSFVSNVRIGKQTKSTRVVIDVKKNPQSVTFVKNSPQNLDVRIK